MKASYRFHLFFWAFLLCAGVALGQGTSGSLNGTVQHDGAPLPGVTVTISSPALQGTRVAVTNVNGDFNFPALPPGQYTVAFEMEGMSTVTQVVRVNLAQASRSNAELQLSSIAEQITVTAAAPAVLETTEVQANYSAELIESLPIGRNVQAATLLAPGVTDNGPASAIVISGAPAYDSLYLVNGAVTNENLRGQTDDLFIEDAIQETSVLVGSISAEYGRFTGGVVSAITKSGGNEFSGSFRDSFTNPSWTNATDFGEDKADSKLNETYEATFGGRIVRDRLWFFLAGRQADTDAQRYYTASTIARPTAGQTDERYEIKLTGQVTPKHSLVGSFLNYEVTQTNYCFISCWEPGNLDPSRTLPREMKTAHYNGILTSNFLLEAGYSERFISWQDDGNPHRTQDFNDPHDLALGTAGYDSAGFGGFFGTPYFCGGCPEETRQNEYYQLKGTYYLAASRGGTHNIIAGYENFLEERFADNYQSGSDLVVYLYNEPPERDANGNVLITITGTDDSSFGFGDAIWWYPILQTTQGTSWTTESLFINDKWDVNSKLSFNIGFRYDANKGKNSVDIKVADDSYFSPRIGGTYDLKGDGRFRVNASYSKYVSRIQDVIGDASGSGGNPSYIGYEYQGPTIGPLPSIAAMEQMLTWFLAQGGTGADQLIFFAGVPGYSTQIRGNLKTPNVEEWTIGFGSQIGSRGFLRIDFMDRNWADFYNRVTTPGDIATNPYGFASDVTVYTNDNEYFKRTYQGATIQGSYRFFDRLNLGGNYTWSESKGNYFAESSGGGPSADATLTFHEYKDFAQNNPVGFLPNDQEHKLRVWLSYDQPLGAFGNLNFSILERFDSGRAYSAVSTLDTRPYVTNPGYLGPPRSVNYYFSNRGAYRWDDASATDLAINYELPIKVVNIFIQGELLNVFDEQAQINGSTSIRILQSFNPFEDTPVEGVDWEKRSTFGSATSPTHYQQARTYRVSAGIRF